MKMTAPSNSSVDPAEASVDSESKRSLEEVWHVIDSTLVDGEIPVPMPNSQLYGTESSSTPASSSSSFSTPDSPSPAKRRKVEEAARRRERNEREKQRSNKISEQFEDLKAILVEAGVAVPRGTKGSILSSAMDYIKMLQLKMQQNDR